MQDAHDSARAVGHRTELRRTSESAPPAPTSLSRLCTRARTRGCTLLHALPAGKRLQPLSPHADLPTSSTYIAPTKSGMASRRFLPLHCCMFGRPHTHDTPHAARNMQHATCSKHHATLHMQHATCNAQHATCIMQHAAHTTKSRGASPVSAAAQLQVGLPARWLLVHVCRWEWSACDEPVFAADNRCVLAQCGTGPQLQ